MIMSVNDLTAVIDVDAVDFLPEEGINIGGMVISIRPIISRINMCLTFINNNSVQQAYPTPIP